MLHFFDGFRTSHEVMKVEQLSDEQLKGVMDDYLIHAHRMRRLSPEHPKLRGSAQNPDVFFQAREAANPFYLAAPGIVQQTMDTFASVAGRRYNLFDYVGSPDAKHILVLMGSGAETVQEVVEYLAARGEEVGLLKVRLYRPFSVEAFVHRLPATTRVLAALDRTKEPGSAGEPLYQDIMTAVGESFSSGAAPFKVLPRVIGGRYGLSSKEFTPAMVLGILGEMRKKQPRNHFTVGIVDDVTGTSLEFDRQFSTEGEDVFRSVFYGLGADGTVGANKNSIKIIGEETTNYAQGYFVYDSRKAGTVTVSHLRFGPKPIHSSYLIERANFVACHQFGFLERYDILRHARPGATFLLNSPYGPEDVWDKLPGSVQRQIIDQKVRLYVIDAYKVAKETGMGGRINTIMQTCFFAISGVLPRKESIEAIKRSISKTYHAKGEEVVRKNQEAVDLTLANLFEVEVDGRITGREKNCPRSLPLRLRSCKP